MSWGSTPPIIRLQQLQPPELGHGELAAHRVDRVSAPMHREGGRRAPDGGERYGASCPEGRGLGLACASYI